MFNFERLQTWQRAVSLAGRVYYFTRQFPDSERFGITSQMRRAAVSISSNIAEGCSRHCTADYVRFLEIATGSLFEVISQGNIALREGWLSDAAYRELYSAAEELSRMLSSLRRSLRAKGEEKREQSAESQEGH